MADNYLISGIQQMGIGIPRVYEAWEFYRKTFGMDIAMFDEAAEANLMLPYTGGEPRERHAVLAINLQGGGGMEIWQYTSRTPQPADFEARLGDFGLYICKMKSQDVRATYAEFQQKGVALLGGVTTTPEGKEHFFCKDPYGNLFEVVPSTDWFQPNDRFTTGGVFGCTIGVSDLDRARKLYSDILGYDTVVYDQTDSFDDLSVLPGGSDPVRRVLLSHSQPRQGAFSQMLGSSEIELVQLTGERKGVSIFKDRMWGDLGFIHLCFDIRDMDALRRACASAGFPFTVDSAADRPVFDMGEAAGNFSYIEDPDGTLIEFVETHKIPLVKKIGWYLNLNNRNPKKPLPKWMLKTLGLNRTKD